MPLWQVVISVTAVLLASFGIAVFLGTFMKAGGGSDDDGHDDGGGKVLERPIGDVALFPIGARSSRRALAASRGPAPRGHESTAARVATFPGSLARRGAVDPWGVSHDFRGLDQISPAQRMSRHRQRVS